MHAATHEVLAVDAHVHVYPCFEVDALLTSALRSLRSPRLDERSCAILLLSEAAGDDWFGALSEAAAHDGRVPGSRTWRAVTTAEPQSLELRATDGGRLFVVAGRQIATVEDLEILALMTTAVVADRLPFHETLEAVQRSGALAVIPWGFGKWAGRRGRIVRGLLDALPQGDIRFGDNGGRLRNGRFPALLERALGRGLQILPGSDPLPLPGQEARVGTAGFRIGAAFDSSRPALSLRRALDEPGQSLETFRRGESLWRFAGQQLRMQWRKRVTRRSGA
jgi:hypothetical protein